MLLDKENEYKGYKIKAGFLTKQCASRNLDPMVHYTYTELNCILLKIFSGNLTQPYLTYLNVRAKYGIWCALRIFGQAKYGQVGYP